MEYTKQYTEKVVRERDKAIAALQIIADRVYPATYVGTDANGLKFYGGSEDASNFAREQLNEIYLS